MLLLPASLDKLAKQFKVEIFKDIFPYSFVTPDNLSYVGSVPAYEYFNSDKVSHVDYAKYCERFTERKWSTKSETISYCYLDCEVLYKVLETFATDIFISFKVNVSNCPTLPSLAFKIFRTHYLPKGIRIPILSNQIFDDISNAYYGGHVDMYIPKGENLFHYDVNSLYPAVIKMFKYPVGLLCYFNGDISKISDYSNIYYKYLGFFKVRVTAPSITHPILPIKRDNTTIYGEGTWEGWYYSDELANAVKYGYTYEIISGYLFHSEDIFSDYVAKMYQMKEESAKDSPNYLISKLLMNSLYGRFGMAQTNVTHELVKTNKLSDAIDKIGLHNIKNDLYQFLFWVVFILLIKSWHIIIYYIKYYLIPFTTVDIKIFVALLSVKNKRSNRK